MAYAESPIAAGELLLAYPLRFALSPRLLLNDVSAQCETFASDIENSFLNSTMHWYEINGRSE